MIRNIIFDVGGVLLDYHWEYTLMGAGISREEAERIGAVMFNHSFWKERYDRGTITDEGMIEEYCKINPADEAVYRWFFDNVDKMHIKRPEVYRRLDELKRQGYNLYILSNYSKHLTEEHIYKSDFAQYFDGAVISYDVHMVKPERRIYETLISKYELNPMECFFFDDSQENIDAAANVGMRGMRVTDEDMLIRVLDIKLQKGFD